jgi:hypothetical protein
VGERLSQTIEEKTWGIKMIGLKIHRERHRWPNTNSSLGIKRNKVLRMEKTKLLLALTNSQGRT